MFTGLIEKVGKLVALEERGGGGVLTVGHEPWENPLAPGESVAVQGACLTVVRCERDRFVCEVLRETLRRTSLGSRGIGAPLNLERALRVGDRLGGHFVTGHVDGTGTVRRLDRAGPDWRLEIECERELLGDIVPKGSVACDGASLTVTAVSAGAFDVHLIPHTWNHTAFRDLRAGDPVNLETDLLAKYVRRQLGSGSAVDSFLTLDTLQRAGFVAE